jgi:cytosine/adenosine deaminase-related metal-dependent hydrolase
MRSYPSFRATRRDVLIAGLAASVLAVRPSLAAGIFSGTEVTAQSHGDGCVLCRMSQAAQFSDAPAAKPLSLPQRMLLAQSAPSPAASGRPGPGRVIVIQPSWVLVPRGNGLDVLYDHDVIVKDDRVEAVRPRQPTTDPRVDASGQILTPGFISGHSHAAAGTLTRGWIEENGVIDRSGPSRSFFRAMDLIDNLSDDDLDDLTALNVAEMVRGGCTTQVEMSLSLKQVQSYVRVATRYGVRGFAAGMVPGMTRLGPIWNRAAGRSDVLEAADADTLAEIAANLKFARGVHGSADGRINMMMGPSVTPVFTAASFKAILDAVAELGTATHVHVQANNNPRHQALIHEYWKAREIEMLQKVGLLNQRLFGAHCYLEDPEKDLAVMANPNFTFIHCPSAAGAGQRSSTQVYPEALAAGVNTSIGFDTHSNDYVENMKLAVIQGRGRAMLLAKSSPVKMKEPTIWDALKSGTLAGANGLGRKDLGRIEAGAKADLCTIDVSGLLIGPGIAPREPWNNLLYANGLSVRNVLIDGEWKLRDGQLTFDDEARVKSRGGEAARKIWDRLEKDGFFVKMPR